MTTTLSEQVRAAINASGVSRYALAEQAGIPESVLSRFMSGKQGVSSSTLDKIGTVLGLRIEVSVAAVHKSRKPGRPKKEKTMQTLNKMTRREWNELAASAAKRAHEENFESRRGVYFVDGVGIIYYDNNPFSQGVELREKLIAEFRAFLKRSNLKERASASWPVSGDDKDYTFAMAIEAEESMLSAVSLAFQQIVADFSGRLAKG